MRLTYGVVAGMLWCTIIALLMAKTGLKVSNNAQILSVAIIVAGAMAGGD